MKSFFTVVALFIMATSFLNCTTANEMESSVVPVETTKNNSEFELITDRVIVFKDGYCLVVKNGTAKTDKNGIAYTDDVPSAAILGSFWAIPSKGTIKSMTAGWVETKSERKRSINAINVIEIVKANLGKQCKLIIANNDSEVMEGTLLKLLSNDELEAPIPSVDRFSSSHAAVSSGPPLSISSTTGSHFILRTDAGDVMLAANLIRNLTIKDMESTVEQTIKETTRHKRLSWNFGEPNAEVKINLIYFRPDVRWIPTYRVNLTDKEFKQQKTPAKGETNKKLAKLRTAEVFMQCELLNEAEDFTDATFHVVVGVPNFRFRSVPSPMILESDLRNSLAQAAPSIMGMGGMGQQQLSNALYTQRGGEMRSNRSMGNEERSVVDLPAELSSSAGNDLFVYKLDKMDLKRGERATIPILRTQVPYRDVYTWDVEITHSESYAATSADSPSPLVLSENKIWRQVELINDTDIPWTTGAAMFVDGFQPLAQELLTYTSPGGICRVPVTVSVDLRGKVEDQEVKRDLNALTWRRNEYARITGKIDIELANNKTEAVPVEVRIRFGGKAKDISDNGKLTLDAFRSEDWRNGQGDPINNSSEIRWKSTIEPGECFNPTTNYEFFLRY